MFSSSGHPYVGLDSILKKGIGRDWKGKLSPVQYIVAIIAALRFPRGSPRAVLVIAALMWLIPDRRIEKHLALPYGLASGNAAVSQTGNADNYKEA